MCGVNLIRCFEFACTGRVIGICTEAVTPGCMEENQWNIFWFEIKPWQKAGVDLNMTNDKLVTILNCTQVILKPFMPSFSHHKCEFSEEMCICAVHRCKKGKAERNFSERDLTDILTSNVTWILYSVQCWADLQQRRMNSTHLWVSLASGAMSLRLRYCFPCRSCRAEGKKDSLQYSIIQVISTVYRCQCWPQMWWQTWLTQIETIF